VDRRYHLWGMQAEGGLRTPGSGGGRPAPRQALRADRREATPRGATTAGS